MKWVTILSGIVSLGLGWHGQRKRRRRTRSKTEKFPSCQCLIQMLDDTSAQTHTRTRTNTSTHRLGLKKDSAISRIDAKWHRYIAFMLIGLIRCKELLEPYLIPYLFRAYVICWSLFHFLEIFGSPSSCLSAFFVICALYLSRVMFLFSFSIEERKVADEPFQSDSTNCTHTQSIHLVSDGFDWHFCYMILLFLNCTFSLRACACVYVCVFVENFLK